MPEWWNGRHRGLKIPCQVFDVRVRVPSPACLMPGPVGPTARASEREAARSVSSFGFALLTEDNRPASACRASARPQAAGETSPTPANPRSSLAPLPAPSREAAAQAAVARRRRQSRERTKRIAHRFRDFACRDAFCRGEWLVTPDRLTRGDGGDSSKDGSGELSAPTGQGAIDGGGLFLVS